MVTCIAKPGEWCVYTIDPPPPMHKSTCNGHVTKPNKATGKLTSGTAKRSQLQADSCQLLAKQRWFTPPPPHSSFALHQGTSPMGTQPWGSIYPPPPPPPLPPLPPSSAPPCPGAWCFATAAGARILSCPRAQGNDSKGRAAKAGKWTSGDGRWRAHTLREHGRSRGGRWMGGPTVGQAIP